MLLNAPVQAITILLEQGGLMAIAARSRSCITLGYGCCEDWWRMFCYRPRMGGYDGWLSAEHEDRHRSRMERLLKSVALLKNVAPCEISGFAPQAI